MTMPIPTGFPECNKVLSAPAGVSEEQCGNLPIFTNGECCISCWQFSAEEIEQLIANKGKLYFVIHSGATQYPMSIEMQRPFR